MPIFEYTCESCEVGFEELFIKLDEVEAHRKEAPCPSCGKSAPRNVVAAFGFKFAGDVRGTSGVHGNSGVHDLDYPTLDKAVARSSEKKWEKARQVQKEINEVRKTSETGDVSMGNDLKPVPLSKGAAETRKKLLSNLK